MKHAKRRGSLRGCSYAGTLLSTDQCISVTILGQYRLSEERGTNEVLRTRKVSQGAAGVKDVKLKEDV
jgi:hypothetical protein